MSRAREMYHRVMARPTSNAARRLEILDAAAAVIAERGWCDTRISDIAERIGASPPLVLYYFESKDDLLAAALAHRSETFYRRVAAETVSGSTARERLWSLIERSCPPVGDEVFEVEWDLWLDTWARARHDDTVAEARRTMDELFRRAIADIVAEGDATGEFSCSDPESFALHLSALIDGLAIQVLLGDAAVTRETMLAISLDVAGRTLGVD